MLPLLAFRCSAMYKAFSISCATFFYSAMACNSQKQLKIASEDRGILSAIRQIRVKNEITILLIEPIFVPIFPNCTTGVERTHDRG